MKMENMFIYLRYIPHIHGWMIIITFLLYPWPAAAAESARDLVMSGNSAYEEGEYEKALAEYEKAGAKDPESAYIDFNKGNVYYRKGDFDSAMFAYEQVSVKNADPVLAARSRFNMGNTAVQRAEQERATDLKKALAGYQAGVRHYRDALNLDSNLSDAAHNIEVSRLHIRQIMEEIKKQEEQQKAAEQAKKEMSDALKKLIREQEQMAGESKDQAEEQGRGKEESRQKGQEQASKQKDVQEKTAELADKMDSLTDQPQSPVEKAKEHVSNAIQDQKEAGDNLEKQNFNKAGESQKQAADELKKALESLNDKKSESSGRKKDQDQDKQGDKEKGDKEQKDGEQEKPLPATPEQGEEGETQPELEVPPPDQTARDLLNEEKENRRLRQMQSTHGLHPVEKDW